MSISLILPLTDSRATLESAGGKGASLAKLSNAGLPVPDGFIVTTAAYRQFARENDLLPRILDALRSFDLSRPAELEKASAAIRERFLAGRIPDEIAAQVEQAYAALPGADPAVAVRSSATAEDLPEASFAGQQDTYLNIAGPRAVLESVRKCWASLWTARAVAYRARQDIAPEGVVLAVVVQRFVPADSAGILFTLDPVSGRRDRVLVNAAWGLGEAVVGGLVTPDTLAVDKATGRVLERQTADKQVMTARDEGATREQPVPERLRRAPVLSDEQAAGLARIGVGIERLYGAPMDVEWAWAEGRFYILQARPVTTTAAPAPAVPPPNEWKVPIRKAMYLRNNIVELMPNPLSPLFDTLGRRLVNQRMTRYMAIFMGRDDMMPAEPIVSINGYAYYSGAFTARQIALVTLKSVGIMRRMFGGMEERWQAERPRYAGVIRRWQSADRGQLSAADLLRGAEELQAAAIDDYLAAVSGLIPAAWMSEAAFTLAYRRLIRRKGDPDAQVFLLGFDSSPIRSEKALYSLAQWVKESPSLAACLLDQPAAALAAGLESEGAPAGVYARDWTEWRRRFNDYLEQFGAAIYDLDFYSPTPADRPEPLLETLKMFLRGKGSDPYRRQEEAAQAREQAERQLRGRLKGLARKLFESRLSRAQKYAPLREDALAEVGLGYLALRRLLLELGARLAAAGALEQPGDVFFLEEGELREMAACLDAGAAPTSRAAEAAERKALMQARKNVTPPYMLPMGRKRKAKAAALGGSEIRGVACSPGRVTAPARVLRGPEDFDQMQPGDILVAAITTPAWTPLFTMAAGIVTDVGGPLSHGSIVAREYGIPAVLGTETATHRIRSGQSITVDGAAGTVLLEG